MTTAPQMSRDDAEEFTAALGQIVGGSYRQIALAQRLGVPAALGLSTEQWVKQRLGGYIRLSIPERREIVAELVEEGLTQRAIASVIGVAQNTVYLDLKRSEERNLSTPDALAVNDERNLSESATSNPIPPGSQLAADLDAIAARNRLRKMVGEAMRVFNAKALCLDPDAVADTLDIDQLTDLLRFRTYANEWIDAVDAARRRGPRAIA